MDSRKAIFQFYFLDELLALFVSFKDDVDWSDALLFELELDELDLLLFQWLLS